MKQSVICPYCERETIAKNNLYSIECSNCKKKIILEFSGTTTIINKNDY